MTTNRDADADLAICNAATPGPWELASSRDNPTILDDSQTYLGEFRYEEDATFAIEAREALPYWIAEAESLEALAEGQSREIETLRAEIADLRSREVIEHGGTYFAPLEITNWTWEWFDASEGICAYVGGESIPRELYVALPGVNLEKFAMAYPTREAAMQALRDAIEVVKKGEEQP